MNLEELTKQAVRRKIGKKAYTVARELGNKHRLTGSYFGDEEAEIRSYRFSKKELCIKAEYEGSSRIIYNYEEVFKEFRGKIQVYVPGNWEKKINELYKQVK